MGDAGIAGNLATAAPIVDCTKFDTNDDDEDDDEDDLRVNPTMIRAGGTKEVSLFIPSNVKVVRTYETNDELNREDMTEVVPAELNRIENRDDRYRSDDENQENEVN